MLLTVAGDTPSPAARAIHAMDACIARSRHRLKMSGGGLQIASRSITLVGAEVMKSLLELPGDCQGVDDGVDPEVAIAAEAGRNDVVGSTHPDEHASRGMHRALHSLVISS